VTDNALSVRGLSVARGERVILRALDLRLEPGETLILSGSNGSGKTTLIRALAGLLAPLAGQIRLSGLDPAREGEAYGAHLHFVGHKDAVKTQFSVRDNLRFWMRLAGLSRDGLNEAVALGLATFNLSALADLPAS